MRFTLLLQQHITSTLYHIIFTVPEHSGMKSLCMNAQWQSEVTKAVLRVNSELRKDLTGEIKQAIRNQISLFSDYVFFFSLTST